MNDYVLYILMRTDLASMNPGKAVAQGAHAANQFQTDHWKNQACIDWLGQGGGFGTTVTLGVNKEQLDHAVTACKHAKFGAQVITDPSYPLRDGEVTHLIPLDTCGYVFGKKDALKSYLSHLELMK